MNRVAVLVIAAVATYFSSTYFVISVLARFMRELSMSPDIIGYLWSLSFLVALITRPIAGYAGDRLGSAMAMAVGSLCLSIASMIYAASESVDMLAIGRAIHGLADAFFISSSIAAATIIGGPRAGELLGFRAATISMTALTIPPVAGYIVDVYGYRVDYIIASMTALITSILSLCIAKYTHRSFTAKNSHRLYLNRIVVTMAIIAMCNGYVFVSLSTAVQIHYKDLSYPATVYGMFMLFFGVASTATRLVAGRLSRFINPLKIAAIGFIVVFLSIAMLSFMYRPPISFVIAAVYGLGLGMTVPTLQLAVARATPIEVRNRALAVYAMGFDAGGLIGPSVTGAVIQHLGYEKAYAVLLIPTLIAAALSIIMSRCRS